MSESSDYDPGYWKDRDFKKSRTTYDAHVGRSYSTARRLTDVVVNVRRSGSCLR